MNMTQCAAKIQIEFPDNERLRYVFIHSYGYV